MAEKGKEFHPPKETSTLVGVVQRRIPPYTGHSTGTTALAVGLHIPPGLGKRAELRLRFRIGVFQVLREQDGIFRGTIRAFALLLSERFKGQSPFELAPARRSATMRIESRLHRLERDGFLRFEWGMSQAYHVVTAIRPLVADPSGQTASCVVGAKRKSSTVGEVLLRRMQLLSLLADVSGSKYGSIVALSDRAVQDYGDHHEYRSARNDVAALEEQGFVISVVNRMRGKPTQAIAITRKGRSALKRYRQRHDGHPLPPAPVIDAAGRLSPVRAKAAVSAPAPQPQLPADQAAPLPTAETVSAVPPATGGEAATAVVLPPALPAAARRLRTKAEFEQEDMRIGARLQRLEFERQELEKRRAVILEIIQNYERYAAAAEEFLALQ